MRIGIVTYVRRVERSTFSRALKKREGHTLRIRLGRDILIRCRWKCGDGYSLGCETFYDFQVLLGHSRNRSGYTGSIGQEDWASGLSCCIKIT
jgi:hypothetical protein